MRKKTASRARKQDKSTSCGKSQGLTARTPKPGNQQGRSPVLTVALIERDGRTWHEDDN
jgi:hypothetical protein